MLTIDWMTRHLLDIIQMSHDLMDRHFYTRVPFYSEIVATETCKCMSNYLADTYEHVERQCS